MTIEDRPFIERFRDWTLDPMDIVDGAVRLAGYYTEVYGVWGYIGVLAVVIFIGLSFDITRPITSQIVSGTYRNVMLLIFATLGLLLAGVARVTSATVMARWRDAARFWATRFRKGKNVV